MHTSDSSHLPCGIAPETEQTENTLESYKLIRPLATVTWKGSQWATPRALADATGKPIDTVRAHIQKLAKRANVGRIEHLSRIELMAEPELRMMAQAHALIRLRLMDERFVQSFLDDLNLSKQCGKDG